MTKEQIKTYDENAMKNCLIRKDCLRSFLGNILKIIFLLIIEKSVEFPVPSRLFLITYFLFFFFIQI